MNKNAFTRILLFLFTSISFTSYAQTPFDLNGVFEGYRQIETDSLGLGEPSLYLYDLKQDGSNVSGKSTVYNEKGYYAEVLIHGVIVENKFYFEEYGTLDQVNPEKKDWCYESGHLDIGVQEGKISLKGSTKSFSKKYGVFCANGYINLEKLLANKSVNFENANQTILTVANVTVSPNPTENIASISFDLSESHEAIIEVYNLEGELILNLLHRSLLAGSYSFELDLSFEDEGMYIVELILDKKIYSTELYKSKF
jgi:hypothetical protein